jgi:ketosteroid isomerase-like protein
MRIIGVGLLLALLAGCGGSTKTESATAELKPFMQNVYTAWQTLDPSKPAEFYAKDPGLLFFDLAPEKFKGWQAYQDGFKQMTADWKAINIDIGPDFEAYKHGDVAWVAYTMSFTIAKKDGKVETGRARGLDVLEKRDGKWLIVSEHVSVPMMEPASDKKEPEAKKPVVHKKKAKKK